MTEVDAFLRRQPVSASTQFAEMFQAFTAFASQRHCIIMSVYYVVHCCWPELLCHYGRSVCVLSLVRKLTAAGRGWFVIFCLCTMLVRTVAPPLTCTWPVGDFALRSEQAVPPQALSRVTLAPRANGKTARKSKSRMYHRSDSDILEE